MTELHCTITIKAIMLGVEESQNIQQLTGSACEITLRIGSHWRDLLYRFLSVKNIQLIVYNFIIIFFQRMGQTWSVHAPSHLHVWTLQYVTVLPMKCVDIVIWQVTIDGVLIGNRIYFVAQLVTTLYKSLSHTYWCSQSRSSLRYLVVASSSGRSPSSGFPNCPLPQLLQLSADWLPADTLPTLWQLVSLYGLGTDRTENVSSLVARVSVAMALCWFHNSAFQQTCHIIFIIYSYRILISFYSGWLPPSSKHTLLFSMYKIRYVYEISIAIHASEPIQEHGCDVTQDLQGMTVSRARVESQWRQHIHTPNLLEMERGTKVAPDRRSFRFLRLSLEGHDPLNCNAPQFGESPTFRRKQETNRSSLQPAFYGFVIRILFFTMKMEAV
jgi:hypothetical protein